MCKYDGYWPGMRLQMHRCSTKQLWRESEQLDTPLTPPLTEHKHVTVGDHEEVWEVVELGDEIRDTL